MKKKYLVIIPLLVASMTSLGTDAGVSQEITPDLKARTEQWVSNTQHGFLENKGQMTDMEQKAAPYLLFKAEGKTGVDMYITQWGLSYVFIQTEEETRSGHLRGMEEGEIIPFGGREENKKIKYCRADMELKGASIKKENIVKEYASKDFSNYYLGHRPEGILNVRRYGKITIKEIYAKIDWMIYVGEKGETKYDFVVHPGGDPGQIKLNYKWTDSPQKQRDGSIKVHTPMGVIREGTPYSYIEETKTQIQTVYVVNKATDEVGFNIDNYNSQQTLILDPQLMWGTYYGGNTPMDGFCSVKADESDNIFVTGYTQSSNFPTFNPGGGAYFQGTFVGTIDAFLLKFSSTGIRLLATYYGGTGSDGGKALALDDSSNVFVTGFTRSTNFPTLNPGGGAYFQLTNGGNDDCFLLKFTNDGVRLLSTYYGGSGSEWGSSLFTDGSGNILATGFTDSGDFPTFNPGGSAYFQGTYSGGTLDAFFMKFTNGGMPLWSTYYGGSGRDYGSSIASDSSGNIFVTGYTDSPDFPTLDPGGSAYFQGINLGGSDVFLLKFNSSYVLLWATYYGGSLDEWGDALAIDRNGNMFVTGQTKSGDFSTLNSGGGTYFQGTYGGGSFWGGDVFILKFTNIGQRLWGTYYGGSEADGLEEYYSGAHAIVTDDIGNVFMTGWTESTNFPTLNPGGGAYFQGTYAGGIWDVFILKFSNAGTLLWATYNGTTNNDFGRSLTIDSTGCLIVAGEWLTAGSNGLMDPGGGAYYDATNNGGDDSFVMKFCRTVLSTTITSTNILCNGQCNGTGTANPAGGNSPYTYNWSNGQTTQTATGLCAGIYTVTITDAVPDIITATVSITESTSLSASITATNINCNTQCSGSSAITVSGGTPIYTYNWSSIPVQTTANATGLCAGNYTATITDANGCTTTQTITIISSGSVTAASQSASICFGSVHTLPGGIVVTTGGTYIDTLISVAGCDSIITTILTVNPGPTATIFSTPASLGQAVTITQGQSVTLTASGGGTYSWSSGSSSSFITVTPPVTTIYCVTVTDANYCSDTACVTVTIEPMDCSNIGDLFLPNAFSPNGDGENDVLQIYYGSYACIKTFQLKIYNRWGEKVFETKNPLEEWYGSYRGITEGTAVFVYYLEATLASGEKITKKGNISLIR